MQKSILDATSGGRMMWFQKNHPRALYVDKRILNKGEFRSRPNFEIKPDIVVSFTAMPFKNGAFNLVLFDPPPYDS